MPRDALKGGIGADGVSAEGVWKGGSIGLSETVSNSDGSRRY